MFNLLPKDDKFFDQLDVLCRLLVDATQQLAGALQVFPHFEQQNSTIEALRRKAEELSQDSLKVLDHARLIEITQILARVVLKNA